MAGKQEEPPEVIICTGKDCGAEIPVIDCYIIVQPETPQIAVKCPICNKVITLSKAKSIGYAKMYPQIQEDLDVGAGFKPTEFDVESEFGDRLMQIMDLFGYGSKHAKMKTIIRSMIDLMPEYQNQQALSGLLLARGVTPKDVQSIAQMACRDPQAALAGALPQPLMQHPYMDPQPPYPQQQYPQQQPPYPQQQQQYPQQQYQPPVMVQQPAPQPPDDSIRIIEKLDSDGTIIERTIVQPKNAPAAGDPVQSGNLSDQLRDVMAVMDEHGLLRRDAVEPQGLTMEGVAEVVANLPSNDNDDAIAALTASMNELKDQLAQKRDDAILNRLESLESGGSYTSGEHSDQWHEAQLSHDMRKEELGLIEKGLEKIVGPFADMQKNASILQTVQNLERMEAAHGVPGGTYTQLLTPTHVSEDQVQHDLGRWRQRAEVA
jgi:hypothetical protein